MWGKKQKKRVPFDAERYHRPIHHSSNSFMSSYAPFTLQCVNNPGSGPYVFHLKVLKKFYNFSSLFGISQKGTPDKDGMAQDNGQRHDFGSAFACTTDSPCMLQYLNLTMLVGVDRNLADALTSISSFLPTVRIANRGPGLKLSSKMHAKLKNPNATARCKMSMGASKISQVHTMPIGGEPYLWEWAVRVRWPLPYWLKSFRFCFDPLLNKIPDLLPTPHFVSAIVSRVVALETKVDSQCCVPSHLIGPCGLQPQTS
jgi:hypothetical protein